MARKRGQRQSSTGSFCHTGILPCGMEPLPPLDNLGELKRRGYLLTVHCASRGLLCGHAKELDLDDLIRRFGEDYKIVGNDSIEKAVKCSACGHPGGKLTLSHSSAAVAGYPNDYRKAKGR